MSQSPAVFLWDTRTYVLNNTYIHYTYTIFYQIRFIIEVIKSQQKEIAGKNWHWEIMRISGISKVWVYVFKWFKWSYICVKKEEENLLLFCWYLKKLRSLKKSPHINDRWIELRRLIFILRKNWYLDIWWIRS